MRMKPTLATLSAGVVALLPTAALAHPGHGATMGFMEGMLHPFSGFDHMLAMMLVGLFAVQRGGRAIVLLPATFVASMAIGSLVGTIGGALSVIEIGIALSITVLGVLVALQARIPALGAMVLVAAIALCHGYAHGAEAGGDIAPAYIAGFLASTAVLHVGGVIAGLVMAGSARRGGNLVLHIAGGVAAAAGLLFVAS